MDSLIPYIFWFLGGGAVLTALYFAITNNGKRKQREVDLKAALQETEEQNKLARKSAENIKSMSDSDLDDLLRK